MNKNFPKKGNYKILCYILLVGLFGFIILVFISTSETPQEITQSTATLPSLTRTISHSKTPLPPLPRLHYKLIWIREGEIRWRSFLNFDTRSLVGKKKRGADFFYIEDVVNFKFSNSKIMAVGANTQMESEKFIIIYNFIDDIILHTYSIVTNGNGPFYSISPDGSKLVYLVMNRKESPSNLDHGYWQYNFVFNIMFLDIETGEHEKIGECDEISYGISLLCERDPVWSSNNRYVAWRGEGGVSAYDFENDRKWLIIEDEYEPDGPNYVYYPQKWSPDYKSILIYQDTVILGRTMIVVDINSLNFEEVPNTLVAYRIGHSIERWLSDGRLLVIWFPGMFDETPPNLSVYKIKQGKVPWFIEEFSIDLEISDNEVVEDGFQLSDNTYIFTTSVLTGKGTNIYKFNLNDRSLEQLGILFIDGYDIFWTPDYKWMLVTDSETILLASTDGSEVHDVTPYFNEEDYYFSWLVVE